MPQHPEPAVRRAIRVLAMVGELHKGGYQKLRVMPYIYATGAWRCSIGPASLFYRNHGAMLLDAWDTEPQPASMVARYTSAAGNQYFGWDDAAADTARKLADKFVERFSALAERGRGYDYPYAGWYQRLLGYAEQGWMPYVFSEYENTSFEKLHLQDLRTTKLQNVRDEPMVLPVPPSGELKQDYYA
jgi:hypothetical protein